MHRRKSLWNNLQGLYGKEPETKAKLEQVLADLGFEKAVRAERLSIEEMIQLADGLFAKKIAGK